MGVVGWRPMGVVGWGPAGGCGQVVFMGFVEWGSICAVMVAFVG